MKALGINSDNNIQEFDAGGGSSLTIQNNEVSLTQRPTLDIVGNYNKIIDDSNSLSTKILLSNNLGGDWYFNQINYPALEWIWYHTDGYWYLVTMILSQTSGYVGSTVKRFKIYKTKDWNIFAEVCTYENDAYGISNPKICMDTNGNILIVANSTLNFLLYSFFFNASNNYAPTVTFNICDNQSYIPETTISLNVSSDNRFGVAFFQKHSASTTYSQLMYVERSAGTTGTWGTPEIIGSTPVRAATVTSTAAPQLFYTSTNDPIIAFLNNQSATSSKVAIAKKVSGTWTVYDSTSTNILNSIIDSNNNIYIATTTVIKFDYSTNSFSAFLTTVAYYLANNSTNSDILFLGYNSLASISTGSIFYRKNDLNTVHRFIRANFQLGAVISANTYSTFGIYTVIPYSRQRLANAYHLVIRADGAIYMEVI